MHSPALRRRKAGLRGIGVCKDNLIEPADVGARDRTGIEAQHGFNDRELRFGHRQLSGESVEVATRGRRCGVLIIVELYAEGLLQLLRGTSQPNATRGAIFIHQREAVARGERAYLIHRLLGGAVGVQVFVAAELAAFQIG